MQFGGRYGFGSVSVRIPCKCETALTRKVPQFLKYLSWSQVYRLKLRHETSQLAATHGGAVCDGSLETLNLWFHFWKTYTL